MNRIEQLISRLGRKEKSEDVKSLLSPGNIERLVRENRVPLRIGQISGKDRIMQPYYQVPPKNFKLRSIEPTSGGCYSFECKDGKRRIGSTYTLTYEQAIEVEKRISAEKAP